MRFCCTQSHRKQEPFLLFRDFQQLSSQRRCIDSGIRSQIFKFMTILDPVDLCSIKSFLYVLCRMCVIWLIIIIIIITTSTRTKKSPTVDRPVVDTTRIKWWIWYRRYLAALSRKLTIRGCHAVFYHGLLIKVSLDTRHFCNSLPKKKPVFVWYQKSGPICSLSWAVVSLCLSLFV